MCEAIVGDIGAVCQVDGFQIWQAFEECQIVILQGGSATFESNNPFLASLFHGLEVGPRLLQGVYGRCVFCGTGSGCRGAIGFGR